MRPTLKFFLPALAAWLTLAACGSSSSGTTSSSSSSPASTPASTSTQPNASSTGAVVVKTASNATLGATVLVNAQGMTLYHLSGEQNGKFICTSSGCLQIWHPVTTSASAPSGSVASLATVKRPDGTVQVTYKGEPLYTFAEDKQPGEAKGQGIKDVGTWTAVTVSASGAPTKQTSQPATTPPAEHSSSGGGGGYGY
jgi:predicted lipoprotein with Yx(FWY)xxD motif